MALWPFGKKKNDNPQEPQDAVREDAAEAADAAAPVEPATGEPATSIAEEAPGAVAATPAPAAGVTPIDDYDPVNGSVGPFDGDNVDIDDFDFTDFSEVALNLGSMRIPLPKGSQVQVEMGEQGPKMVHIVTEFGRLTPVAFAAPTKGGLWEDSSKEILEGMQSEGMPTAIEQGPWGSEIVGTGANGAIRIIGVEGPRWLYRVTAAAPSGREEQLAELARETVARSFVYRGQDAILAGNSLPVTLPAQLAAQVQQAVEARAAQQSGAATPGQAPTGGNPNALQDALRQIMELNNPDNQNRQ